MSTITIEQVHRCMSAHLSLYKWRKPHYQHVMLSSLQRLWVANHHSALDVGGGTGVMAQMVKVLFGVDRVSSVDVENRYLPSLDIDTAVFDGRALPFPDGSFDCVLLFNVLHHVPVAAREQLLLECRRVAGRGPLYIKDHVSGGTVDDLRLAALDLLGNVPFHGMVTASYLREREWNDLAVRTGHRIEQAPFADYRTGVATFIFPNRLETSMRWLPR